MPNLFNKLTAPFKQLEERDVFTEIRQADGEEGIFEGYIVLWDQVDSYRSKFVKGAFADTIKNDLEKMKVFYEHATLVGKPLEAREDDQGVWVRGQINLNTMAGRDAWEFIKDGTVDGLSFRFRSTAPESFQRGVRVINKVQMREFGPVIFPAGDRSKITNLRSTFSENFDMNMIHNERNAAMSALYSTLDELYYSMPEDADVKAGEAIDAFRTEYLDWMSRYGILSQGQRAELLAPNSLALEVWKEKENGFDFANLTEEEQESLMEGKLIEQRAKLEKMPEGIRREHQKIRNDRLRKLCTEIRSGGDLSPFEVRQIEYLLEPVRSAAADSDLGEIAALLQGSRELFKG